MNYQPYDYETDTDAAPWTAAPAQSQMVSTPQSNQMLATPVAVQAAPVVAAPIVPGSSEMLTLGSMIQSIQQTQMQQVYLLRDFDTRIGRLEQSVRPAAYPANQTASFERATWWAIWGLLMLILGGALAIVTVLILMNIQFR